MRAKKAGRHTRGHQTGVVTPSRAQVRRAIESLPAELAWADVSDSLRPVFTRRRPLPPGMEKPLTFATGLGLDVALGIDLGPAFVYVGPSMVERWPVSATEAFERAMTNLRDVARTETYYEIEFGTVADVPMWWYQSRHGLASGLLLLHDELNKRFGDEPRLLVAPMRNLLIAAPFDADREVLGYVRDEIAFEDPNGLDLPILALVDGRLAIDSTGHPQIVEVVH